MAACKEQDFKKYVQMQLTGPRPSKKGKGLAMRKQPGQALTNASSGVTGSMVGPMDPSISPHMGEGLEFGPKTRY